MDQKHLILLYLIHFFVYQSLFNLYSAPIASRAGDKPIINKKHDVADLIRELVMKEPGITAVEVKEKLKSSEVSKKAIDNSIRYLKRNIT